MMNEINGLKVEDKTCPSGASYKAVTFDGLSLGSYIVSAEGYLPTGKRKPRETEFAAILDLIADGQREINKQTVRIERARDEVFRRQDEFRAKS